MKKIKKPEVYQGSLSFLAELLKYYSKYVPQAGAFSFLAFYLFQPQGALASPKIQVGAPITHVSSIGSQSNDEGGGPQQKTQQISNLEQKQETDPTEKISERVERSVDLVDTKASSAQKRQKVSNSLTQETTTQQAENSQKSANQEGAFFPGSRPTGAIGMRTTKHASPRTAGPSVALQIQQAVNRGQVAQQLAQPVVQSENQGFDELAQAAELLEKTSQSLWGLHELPENCDVVEFLNNFVISHPDELKEPAIENNANIKGMSLDKIFLQPLAFHIETYADDEPQTGKEFRKTLKKSAYRTEEYVVLTNPGFFSQTRQFQKFFTILSGEFDSKDLKKVLNFKTEIFGHRDRAGANSKGLSFFGFEYDTPAGIYTADTYQTKLTTSLYTKVLASTTEARRVTIKYVEDYFLVADVRNSLKIEQYLRANRLAVLSVEYESERNLRCSTVADDVKARKIFIFETGPEDPVSMQDVWEIINKAGGKTSKKNFAKRKFFTERVISQSGIAFIGKATPDEKPGVYVDDTVPSFTLEDGQGTFSSIPRLAKNFREMDTFKKQTKRATWA